MRYLIYLFVIIQPFFSFNQKRSDISVYSTGDTSLWYFESRTITNKIELIDMEKSKSDLMYRFWIKNQIVEISESSNGTMNGNITYWSNEVVPKKEKPTNRVYFKKFPLDGSQTERLFHLIDSMKIDNIPDENEIILWHLIKDGITYIIEKSDSSNYSFKTYESPSSQLEFYESNQIDYFLNEVYRIIANDNNENDFISSIPFECFNTWGTMMACKVVYGREKRKFKQERRRYRHKN